MKRKSIFSLILLCALSACSSSNDEETKDMTKPVITDTGITANPIDCQTYRRCETVAVHYVFTDNVELGNYNIEIHHNFDHHTHWVFNQDYSIPNGQRSYTARVDIPIPADIDPGDYHFMIRLTDKAGWQELKAVAIKIKE